jgi:hypothetical protein
MKCKPRKIIGNLPFSAIPKDFNRYCGRLIGNIIPDSAASWVLYIPLGSDSYITSDSDTYMCKE